MDDRSFDRMTRHIGRQADRRTMVKTALGGTLALLGLGGLAGQVEGRNNSRRTGFKDDSCATSGDCLSGLTCEGAKNGIAPGFPTPIDIPIINGKEGKCKYRKSCGGEQGDVCRRNDDCCSGQNLTCDNNRCKRK